MNSNSEQEILLKLNLSLSTKINAEHLVCPQRQDPKTSSWRNPIPYFLVYEWIDLKEIVQLIPISVNKLEPRIHWICEMSKSRNVMQD